MKVAKLFIVAGFLIAISGRVASVDGSDDFEKRKQEFEQEQKEEIAKAEQEHKEWSDKVDEEFAKSAKEFAKKY